MATTSILAIQSAVKAAGFRVTGAPIVDVRNIANTNTPSEHGKGNAIDYSGSSSELERLYQFLLAAKKSGALPVATLCYDGPGGRTRHSGCTTVHDDHLHVDGYPHVASGSGAGSGNFRRGPTLENSQTLRDLAASPPGGLIHFDNPLTAITGAINALFDFRTYVRIGLLAGGSLALGAGILWVARELGAPVPTVKDALGVVKGVAVKAASGGVA